MQKKTEDMKKKFDKLVLSSLGSDDRPEEHELKVMKELIHKYVKEIRIYNQGYFR